MSGRIVSREDPVQSERHSEAGSVAPPSKVGVPPRKNAWEEFKSVVNETFFSDQPLRHFKDQPKRKKVALFVQGLFPVFQWGRGYNFSKFKGDLIAGLTIASLCIPQDIGYAKLANLPAENGLYSSFVPPLVYAVMGSSRDIAIGPVAVVSLLLGTLLSQVYDPVKEAEEYKRLAFTATFFAGVTQLALGFLRLGFLIDFLSHAAIVGFMGGAAVTIALQQLKGLLGIKNFTKKTDIISVMRSVWSNVQHGWNWQTILIGVSFLVFLLATKYIGKKHKKLFWIPAIAPLTSVILSTFFVYITRADKDGVQIVKHIDKGINPPSLDQIFFHGDNLTKGFKIGVVAGLIALTEAVAIARTFADLKDYEINGNKEMMALGTMNIAGSMTSCYVATGSFSRSAVNYMAGCSTPMSNIVMACVVLLTLELITPLFKYTPNAILASIIICAVIGLIDIDAVILLWKIDKFDFIACMGAFFGVVFDSVEIGLLIAVSLSLFKILLQVTRPRIALLGKLPKIAIFRNILQYPGAKRIDGILMVRVDSSIYFSNANYVKERILRWLADETEKLKDQSLPIKVVVIDMSPVNDIDTSGIHAIEGLYSHLQKKEIELALANPGPVIMEKLLAANFDKLIGEDNIFLSVNEAIKTYAPNAALDP
ncbi:High affinity sulfate transporter 2, partial [Cucurbita argyrosperma subsp. sororia]